MYTRATTCCFSGHRPEKLPWGGNEKDPRCLNLKARLEDAVETAIAKGYRHFVVGMAAGVDLYCCEIVLSLRRRYPITLEAAVPCRTQAQRWAPSTRLRYEKLLSLCDRVTVLQEQYDSGCMMRRNRYMVDHASLLIAVYDGGYGGTRNTVEYAMANRVEVVFIPPV